MPNAHQPNVLILPEDAACRDVANGFVKRVDRERAVRVEKPRKGWTNATDALVGDYDDDAVDEARRRMSRISPGLPTTAERHWPNPP